MQYIKLFCIPYAGGSSSVYFNWKQYISSSIELCPVELAGRGKRFREPLYDSFEMAVEDVYNIISKSAGDSDFAVFGHSMGSIIAYEVCRKFKKEGLRSPAFVFCSGRKAPHFNCDRGIHTLPEEQFNEEIFKLGGTPREVFENKELLSIFSPILRADYRIVEMYRHSGEDQVLDCPLASLYGDKDEMMTRKDAEEWREYTKNRFDLYEFKGGHFFINDYRKEIVNIINESLLKYSTHNKKLSHV